MELGQQQQIATKQIQTVSVEQLRSLAILQLPIMELYNEISNELEENPLLEVSDEQRSDYESPIDEMDGGYSHKELIALAEDYSYRNCDFISKNELPDQFSYIKTTKSLKQHLIEQLMELPLSRISFLICRNIIENINARGFLECGIDEIASNMRVCEDAVLDALKIVHELEPEGIGSRGLDEFLCIQLEKKRINDKKLYYIAKNCLELLAENKIKTIAKVLSLSVEMTVQCCDVLKTLNPFPTCGYNDEVSCYIIPDAYVTDKDGVLTVLINDKPAPRLTVSNVYRKILSSSDNEAEKKYIKEKMSKAIAFIKSIDSRAHTLKKTFEAIVHVQPDFFRTSRNLKPMTLKDIADKLDMHESTISRAIKDKYIMSPTKIICVRDMFCSKLESSGSDCQVSSHDAKSAIRHCILNENSKKPLSDQQILERLQEEGIQISRRTVAKYREAMGIAASNKRKEF